MEFQVRNDEGEILNQREFDEDEIEGLRAALEEVPEGYFTGEVLSTVERLDDLLSDLEPCQHDGETYVDEGGWEYCAQCDQLLPADFESTE
jgi:hypothetical protein